MFGPAFFIIAALAVISVQPSSALTTQEATTVCALLPDGEKIANPLDCSQFYACAKGKAILSSCLGSNLFSKESQACVPPNQSSCGSEDSDPCAYMSDGYFVSVPNSCSEFFYCDGGKATKSSCGSGLNFDQADQACKYQSEYPCTETLPGDGNINICEVVRSGIYFGVSSSCKSWQKCQVNGPSEIDDCPSPYFFNVDTGACDYEENVNCRQLQENPGTGGSSLEGTACNTNGEVRSDSTCTGYYVCTNGKFAFGKCTNGKYFNPPSKTCVSRLNAINDCDRCEGTKLQFVNVYQDNCKTYAYCHNGKTQSTGDCKKGYFSEVSGSCVQNGKNPEYPVCYVPEEPTTVPPTESAETEPSSDTTESKTNTDSTTSKSTTESESKSTTEAATISTTEPASESTKDSATKSTTESATESTKDSATKSTTESATEPTEASAAKSTTESASKSTTEEENESEEK